MSSVVCILNELSWERRHILLATESKIILYIISQRVDINIVTKKANNANSFPIKMITFHHTQYAIKQIQLDVFCVCYNKIIVFDYIQRIHTNIHLNYKMPASQQPLIPVNSETVAK